MPPLSNSEKMRRYFYRRDSAYSLQELRERFDGEIPKPEIKKWYDKQDLSQLYKRGDEQRAKTIYNHSQISRPNRIHELDVLYLPNDNGYKYALTCVDVASRYKGAEALRSTTSEEVLEAYKTILRRPNWEMPQVVRTDGGSEFKGAFKDWVTTEPDLTQNTNSKGHHLSFVEVFNRELGKRIFKNQSEKELANPSTINREWRRNLQRTIKSMNNKETRLIKQKPIDAVKTNDVEQPENKNFKFGGDKFRIRKGTKVRVRLERDMILDVPTNKVRINWRDKRATDPVWTKDIYTVLKSFKPKKDRMPDAGAIYYHQVRNDRTDQVDKHMYNFFELLVVKKRQQVAEDEEANQPFQPVRMVDPDDGDVVVARTRKEFIKRQKEGYEVQQSSRSNRG